MIMKNKSAWNIAAQDIIQGVRFVEMDNPDAGNNTVYLDFLLHKDSGNTTFELTSNELGLDNNFEFLETPVIDPDISGAVRTRAYSCLGLIERRGDACGISLVAGVETFTTTLP